MLYYFTAVSGTTVILVERNITHFMNLRFLYVVKCEFGGGVLFVCDEVCGHVFGHQMSPQGHEYQTVLTL